MKARLDEQTIALRVAREFKDGMIVNLGFGIPTLAANFIPEDKEVIFHAENGCLGYGPMPAREEDEDFHLVNATGTFATRKPGMCFFAHDDSFSMIRGRHIDLCVLGALQVSEKGDLANWTTSVGRPGNIGGAMDLAFGAYYLIVVMTHTTKTGEPKILKQCTYPLTAPHCVNLIISDISVIGVTPGGLVLKETAPGWEVEEIQALTEPKLKIAGDLKQMEL
ncbi:MAG TPA: 3-oxoacid CoA-transferase subunit B [Dehalococcoidales bacterium]|nr:3-oxoacid CoA-transferase subunit B [Dehalococcoidales bacterium]